jgi:hypothetical protein
VGTAEAALEGIFDLYKMTQTAVFSALAEPPPPPDEEFALKILGVLAEGVAGLVLGRLGSAVVGSLTAKVGSHVADAAKDVIKTYTKEAGTAISNGVQHQGALGHVRQDPVGKSIAANPAAKTLLDQFKYMQESALVTAFTTAKVRLLLVQDAIARVDRNEIQSLAAALLEYSNTPANFSAFEAGIATGWMNFCASSSLGPKAASSPTMMPGANQPGGVAGAGVEATTVWRDAHDGFLDIDIEVPDSLYGYAGFKLATMNPTGGPGLGRMLHKLKTPVMALPVYRRIWLTNKATKLYSDPTIVITPEGSVEVDVSNGILAAIGEGSPRDYEDAWQRGESTQGNAAERWIQRGWHELRAHKGADLVVTWLAQFSTDRVKP